MLSLIQRHAASKSGGKLSSKAILVRWQRQSSVGRGHASDRMFGTYYDSQSGMHVKTHNAEEISVFLWDRSSSVISATTSQANNIVSSDDSTQQWLEQILTLQKNCLGLAGVVMEPNSSSTLLELADALASASKPCDDGTEFMLFASASKHFESSTVMDSSHPYPSNVNLLFEYDDEGEESNLESNLSSHGSNNTKSATATSIQLIHPMYYQGDLVQVASNIASLMDATGGGDYIWLTPESSSSSSNTNEGEEQATIIVSDDDIVELCEELAYLDVAGPTIKSRLVVAAQSEDQVEECLTMGVNKFVLATTDNDGPAAVDYAWFEKVVKDQGKHFLE